MRFKKEAIVRYLVDLGIYIVTHAQDRDPFDLGVEVAKELRFHSIDTESLLTAIYAVKHFGVDEDLKNSVERVIANLPIYETVRAILGGSGI
jgi:hypothetical protein